MPPVVQLYKLQSLQVKSSLCFPSHPIQVSLSLSLCRNHIPKKSPSLHCSTTLLSILVFFLPSCSTSLSLSSVLQNKPNQSSTTAILTNPTISHVLIHQQCLVHFFSSSSSPSPSSPPRTAATAMKTRLRSTTTSGRSL